MVQLASNRVVDPFGEVNVFPQADGRLLVRATVLMRPSVEGAQTGLAVDGSTSMKDAFGHRAAISSIFGGPPNLVEPVCRALASFLAAFDGDGKTTVIYWACGVGGTDVEEMGDMDAGEAERRVFPAPKSFGTGTRLLPAVKYFTETKFPNNPWSIFVFITDGVLDDFEDVVRYSLELARQIAAGQRGYVKLVAIGLGAAIDPTQLTMLDDLDYGGLRDRRGDLIDLWDVKQAADMRQLEEIFAEVVTRDTLVAPSAVVLDDQGRPVSPLDRASYVDGLPAYLEFSVPAGVKFFKLIVPGGVTIEQSIVV